jgi:hypothetical protein
LTCRGAVISAAGVRSKRHARTRVEFGSGAAHICASSLAGALFV